jgi:hypothetical protein
MDPSSLSPLLPLGGGFFLLVYLIGTLINDRIVLRRAVERRESQHNADRAIWERERDEMRARCRQEIVDATADLFAQAKFHRDRIVELEHEVHQLRHGAES